MTDILSKLDDYGGWIAAVVAGIVALIWLAKKCIHVVLSTIHRLLVLGEKIDRLDELATYELKHNSGHSIKDAVSRIPAIDKRLKEHIIGSETLIEQGRQERDAFAARLDYVERTQADTITHLAQALTIVARSTPPPTETPPTETTTEQESRP